MNSLIRIKTMATGLLLFLFCLQLSAQQMIEIPNVKNYMQVASSLNGGPSLATGDEFGRSVANIGDLNNDGITDIAVGVPLDNSIISADGGSVYICFMNTDGSVKNSPAPVKIGANMGLTAGDNFGISVAGIGDLNGDGNEDIAVGAYKSDDPSYADCGAVYILFLNSSGTMATYQKITRATTEFSGLIGANSYFGFSVANIGDINNDQTNDIAVGAYNHDGTQGAVFVLRLRSNGKVKDKYEIKEGSGNLGANTLDGNDGFGYAVCGAGDLNGDGIEDLIAGANGDDDGYNNAGALWVVYLDTSGAVSNKKKISNPLTASHYYPASTGVSFGECVSTTDINEDGIKDIMAGVKTFNASKGAFYFMVLDASQNVQAIKTIGFNYGWTYGGPGTAPQFGCSISEINLSGNTYHKQYIVGANFHNQSAATQGSFYYVNMDSLTFNFPPGEVMSYTKISDASGDFTATIGDGENIGSDAAIIGDLNNDGVADIAVGASGNTTGPKVAAGAVYILFMTADGRVSSHVKLEDGINGCPTLEAGGQFGWGVGAAGDLDNDGVEDLLVGAPLDNTGGTDRGVVYILYMNTNGTVKTSKKIQTSGLVNNDRFGIDVDTIGDLDNDGVVDLVVGVYLSDQGGTDKGAVDIVFMNSNGTVKSSHRIGDSDPSFSETFANSDLFGIAVDGIGDFNGDGKEDILVGSNSSNSTGAVYVIYLDTDGDVLGFKKINNAASNFPYALKTGKGFGGSVQMIPDIDGNGIRDVAISQTGYTTYGISRGAVWLAMLDSAANVLNTQLITDSCGRLYTNMHATYVFGGSVRYYGTDTLGNVKLAVGIRDDDVGSDRGGLLVLHLVATESKPVHKFVDRTYAVPKKQPDENYYLASGLLKFSHIEEYNDADGLLNYTIYKISNHSIAAVYTNQQVKIVYGQNRCSLNLNTLLSGSPLPLGDYMMEITNDKNERTYLKFKKI